MVSEFFCGGGEVLRFNSDHLWEPWLFPVKYEESYGIWGIWLTGVILLCSFSPTGKQLFSLSDGAAEQW